MKTQTDNLGKVAITVEQGYWDINKHYDKLTVVEVKDRFATYISRVPVPSGISLDDRKYWIPFSSLKEEVLLAYNGWVNRYGSVLTSQAEAMNSIQEKINEIYSSLPKGIIFYADEVIYTVATTYDPTTIYYTLNDDGVYTEITPTTPTLFLRRRVNWYTKTIQNKTYFKKGNYESVTLHAETVNKEPAKFILYKNEELLREYEDASSFEFTETVNAASEYQVVCIQNEYVYRANWSIVESLPTYLGSATVYTDVLNDTNQISISPNISGIYSTEVHNDGDKLFLITPTSSTVESFTMNGVSIPLNAVRSVSISEIDYNIYESESGYEIGIFPVQINNSNELTNSALESLLTAISESATKNQINAVDNRIEGVNEDIQTLYNMFKNSGTSENRPTIRLFKGYQYFDTTLGKPIYWNGDSWIDALGTILNNEE